MLRANSEIAAAIKVAPPAEKPAARATERPFCRASTMSLSDLIVTLISCSTESLKKSSLIFGSNKPDPLPNPAQSPRFPGSALIAPWQKQPPAESLQLQSRPRAGESCERFPARCARQTNPSDPKL